MAPKEPSKTNRAAASRPGRGFTIVLRGHQIIRSAGAKIGVVERQRVSASRAARLALVNHAANGPTLRFLAVARTTLLLVVVAVSGCAPVGPNFERPAAIVSSQFKEIRGWKIATPRESEPKGAWWSVFHDPELDQLMRVVVVSNQTVKADEANYREALALINEAPRSPRNRCLRSLM